MTNVLILTQKPEKLFWYHLWEPIGTIWLTQKLETKIPSKVPHGAPPPGALAVGVIPRPSKGRWGFFFGDIMRRCRAPPHGKVAGLCRVFAHGKELPVGPTCQEPAVTVRRRRQSGHTVRRGAYISEATSSAAKGDRKSVV